MNPEQSSAPHHESMPNHLRARIDAADLEKESVKDGSLALQELECGQILQAVCGEGERQYIYEFLIKNTGELPRTLLRRIGPDGRCITTDEEVTLAGSGRWLNRGQNPMIRSTHLEFTVAWGAVHEGQTLFIFRQGQDGVERYELQPAISKLAIRDAIDEDYLLFQPTPVIIRE